ncbi:hypothetical protein MITS9504_02151 [Synechococcus sp. MIT S9504]|nr:hypothetical protein MITS9504_02151 [Synechococcus sp. MIT S9504]
MRSCCWSCCDFFSDLQQVLIVIGFAFNEINVIAVINVPNCVMFLLMILSLSLSFRSSKPWIYVWFSQGFCDVSR